MINIFLLTYNEGEMFTNFYGDEFVNTHFKSNNIRFVVLDNGNQPIMKEWCEKHDFIYYGSEYNIGSSVGYNWIFKTAAMMGLDFAILMQADVEVNSAKPFFIMQDLCIKENGESFICWPQELYGFWLSDSTQLRKFGHDIHNLGNLVGFNPQVQKQKDCYFDENFVVTHFDDVEFICWLNKNKRMKVLNASLMLGYETNQYYVNVTEENPYSSVNCFCIESDEFKIKIHHSSILIDRKLNNIENSHKPWLDFNKPYFDLLVQRDHNRLGYDHTRWTRFGYPKYPVEHEMKRFVEQYPNLIRYPHMFQTID